MSFRYIFHNGFSKFAIHYTQFCQWVQVSNNLCFLNEAPFFKEVANRDTIKGIGLLGSKTPCLSR